MKLFDALRPANALTTLLEKERAALLGGDFVALQKISVSKESLMKLVARTRITQKEIDALHKLTNRNRRLLVASARGIKSAQNRISNLQAKPAALNTYGPSGRITQISDKSLTIKRKA
jgi:hypothetical protein